MRTWEVVAALATLAVVAAGISLRSGSEEEVAAIERAEADRASSESLAGPESPFEEPEPVEPTFPFVPGETHRSEFGPELERGGGSARIGLVDSAGRPVPSRLIRAGELRLWRRVGSRSQEMDLRLEEGCVCSEGIGGAGLEPSRYLLEAAVPGLGSVEHEFVIGKGERHQSLLRFTERVRVVSLRFVTADLAPIAMLDGLPTFVAPTPDPLPNRAVLRGRLLRGPPDQPQVEDSTPHSNPTREAANRELWATDRGLFHVPVVAGVAGAVEWRSTLGAFKSSALRLESDFLGPEWVERQVVLELAPDAAERMQSPTVANLDDPGNRSLAALDTDAAVAEAAVAPNTEGKLHWVLEGRGVESLDPKLYDFDHQPVDLSTVRPGAGARSVPLHLEGGRWTAELDPARPYFLAPGDGLMYRPEPFFVQLGNEGSTTTHWDVDAEPFTVELRLCRTAAAFSRVITCMLPQRAEHAVWYGSARPLQRDDETTFRIHGFLDEQSASRWRANPAISVAIGWHDEGRLRWNERWFDAPTHGTVQQLVRFAPRVVAESIDAGKLSVDLRETANVPYLILRAVDVRGAGLPWVEATLIRAEDDPLAQAMRERLGTLDSPAERRRVEIQERTFEGVVPALLADERTAVRVIGHRACELFDAVALRKRLYEQGTWYETRSLAQSDEYGYLILSDPRLRQGERFVLYLWSQSSDDLQPDRRVEFDVSGSVTDLGTFSLPTS